MQQFIRDFGLRLRSERRTQIITGLVVLALAWLMFGDGSVRRRSAKPQAAVQVGSNDPQENWRDLIDRFNGQLNQLTAVSNAN